MSDDRIEQIVDEMYAIWQNAASFNHAEAREAAGRILKLAHQGDVIDAEFTIVLPPGISGALS